MALVDRSTRFAAACATLAALLPAGAGAAPPATVSVVRVAEACLSDRVFFTGATVARDEAIVYPEVDGARVSEILAKEGDQVRADQVLARLARSSLTGRGDAEIFEVKSPADGLVVRSIAKIGGFVSPSAPEPLFRIARDGDIEVEAELPEPRIERVKADQAARFDGPTIGSRTGRVRFVSPDIDRQTQTGRVRVAPDGERRMPHGAAVIGSIEVRRSCGLAVPATALIARGDAMIVQRVRDGVVDSQAVRVGIVEGVRAEIVEGLAAGDMVVARAGAFLRDGEAVRAVDLTAESTAARGPAQ